MEDAAPKTKKATIEWLRAQLDAKQLDLLRCQKKNEELYKVLEDRNDQLHFLSRDLDRTKRELAEERAWADIHMTESDATRKDLHRLITNFELERM